MNSIFTGHTDEYVKKIFRLPVKNIPLMLSWKCRRRVVSPDPPKRHVVRRHADVS